MSNVAFDLEVFKQVSKDPGFPIPGNATAFAALGSIGPDLYQYIPISSDLSKFLQDAFKKVVGSLSPADVQTAISTQQLPDRSALLTSIFNAIPTTPTNLRDELFEKPLMAAYAILFQGLVIPFWAIFQNDSSFLDQLQTAANNQDGDAVKQLAGQINQIKTDADTLNTQFLPAIVGLMLLAGIFVALPTGMELVPHPPAPNPTPWLPQLDRPFEFLRWHHTALFAQNLVKLAGSDDQNAYAYGYLCHVAASVTGKPFINNIVGGPYRTHWWRNRLVSNFVDAWTFGRYETPGASMTGDTPNPIAPPSTTPYSTWKTVCSANLQDQLNIAGLAEPAGKLPPSIQAVADGVGAASFPPNSPPGSPPGDLAAYIQQAITKTYPLIRPLGFTTAANIDDATQQAFVGLFAVVWFMTSGFGPMTPLVLGTAPSTCTTPPTWVTSGGAPPSPQQSGPSTAATVCGVLLAILAALLFLFQAYAAGAAAVAGAIALFLSGGGIDWNQLQCDVFWLRSMLLKAELAVIDALVGAALAYPPLDRLSNMGGPAISTDGSFLTKSIPSSSRAAPFQLPYPLQMDASIPAGSGLPDLDFSKFPPQNLETPATMNLPLDPSYADSVVDGSGLQNGGLLPDGPFPSRNQFFGDAVSNAKQLIGDQAGKLPRYNLDADRGYGWKTWNPKPQTFPGTGSVDPNPEL